MNTGRTWGKKPNRSVATKSLRDMRKTLMRVTRNTVTISESNTPTYPAVKGLNR
jgi:hypothetical protein